MKLFKIFTLSVLSALLLVSCVQKDTTVYENADDMVAAAKAEIKTMGMEELKVRHLGSGSETQHQQLA